MSPEALKEKIIERGLISIQTEDKEYKRRGGKAGFELCRHLHTPQDFERVLAERHRSELYIDYDAPEEIYLEHRWGTLQVIHVFERLKVLWKYPVLSTFAVMHVTELLIEDMREGAGNRSGTTEAEVQWLAKRLAQRKFLTRRLEP